MVAHEQRAVGADVDRVVVVEQQRRRRAARTTHESALLQRLVVGKRLGVRRAVRVDEDAGCGDAGLGADNVSEMKNGEMTVNEQLYVRRVIASVVERHQPQTDVKIPASHKHNTSARLEEASDHKSAKTHAGNVVFL